MDRAQARKKAEALVAKMTIEERAGQLKYDAPAIERLGIPTYNWWNEALHGVARAGTATVFPQAIGCAAMFDEEEMQKIADVIAEEGRAKYNAFSKEEDRDIYKGLTFWSPNINIFRDPRWGRGHETYGEDPFLTARLGVSFIKGLQGDGETMKVAACAKHFAVHSGPEAIRHEFDAGFCGLIHLQQFEHCGAGVFDFNQGGGHGFRRGEILVHQYDRRTGFVKVFFVFGVGQVGQGAGFALFDRGDGVHLGLFVACDLAAEKTGDHFCGKFHHSNIVIRGIFLCLFLRA